MFLNHVSQRVLFFLSTRPISHHFPNQHVHANTARAFHDILVLYSMRHVFRGVESDCDINVFHNFITNQK